jgi:hypothetical protein
LQLQCPRHHKTLNAAARDTRFGQFLRQSALVGLKRPLASASGLRGVSGNVLNAQLMKEHAGVLAGGVFHGDHQVTDFLWYPAVRADILVEHHAWQGGAFVFDAVFAGFLGGFDRTCLF